MKILLSKVENLSDKSSRFFPIQSKKQFISYISFTVIGFLLFQIFLIVFETSVAPPSILIFSFIGSSVALRMTLPGRFFVDAEPAEKVPAVLSDILARLDKYGYKTNKTNNSTINLESKLPALLKWEQNRISIFRSNTRITITGPIFMMQVLRGNLEMKPPLFNNNY